MVKWLNSPLAFLQFQSKFCQLEPKMRAALLQEFHPREKFALVDTKPCSKDFPLIWNVLYSYCNRKTSNNQILC